MFMQGRKIALGVLLSAGVFALAFASIGTAASTGWPLSGGDALNTRSAPDETAISPQTVSNLQLAWIYKTGGDVSSTPTVDATGIYVADWGGEIAKVDPATGHKIWVHNMRDYTHGNRSGIQKTFSRNSPALTDTLAIFGDQGSGTVVAVKKSDGSLVWKSVLDNGYTARITSSPTVFNGRVYVGVSSYQEAMDVIPSKVPTFRGSAVALDLNTGNILWQTYMAPSGYTGAPIWGSSPVPDAQRNSLYVTTGDNYSLPVEVETCLAGAITKADQLACMAPDNYVDSIVSLDMDTGKVNWAYKASGADAWSVACLLPKPGVNCPSSAGDDTDFGSGVNFINTVDASGKPLQLVGAGQKSGDYWALNPDNGTLVWHTAVAPGGFEGGIVWGSATDGKQIYCAVSNADKVSFKLAPSYTESWNGGSWAALNAATGEIKWQIKETGKNPIFRSQPPTSSAALTVANGVLFAGSQSGDMLAIDTSNGNILWQYTAGGTVMDGPSIVNGVVYWGDGYPLARWFGKSDNKLYAFKLP